MVTLTSRVHISCARRLHFTKLSDAENQWLWADDWSKEAIGHNLTIEATIGGKVQDQSGYLMHPPALEELIRQTVEPLDHQFLNTDVAAFKSAPPSLELIANWVYQKLSKKLVTHLNLKRIRILSGPLQWVDRKLDGNCSRTEVFSIQCVHRHHNPELSMTENQALYHKCATTHGHSYQLEVTIERPIQDGLVIPRGELHKAVDTYVVKPLHGTFLNEHLGNTSGEIIAGKIFNILSPHLAGLVTVAVRETRKNSFFLIPDSNHSEPVISQI